MASRNVHTYNNIRVSEQEVAQLLWQAGIRDLNAIAVMVPIAMRESSGRAGVQGTTMGYGARSGDMGLFQINWGAHGQRLLDAGIIRSHTDLYNPVINAQAAAYLSGNGNPQAMRQLWGLGKVNGQTTWVGASGHLPAPNWGAVQGAQASGLLGRPYSGGGAGSNPMPPGVGAGLTGSGQTAMDFYNSQNQALAAQIGVANALAQQQSGYAKAQQGYQNQLLQQGMSGIDLEIERLALQNKYNQDLALLSRGLSEAQVKANDQTWRQLGVQVAELQKRAESGMLNAKSYYEQSHKLQVDIANATKKWVTQQKGFNNQDYNLALKAIQNVITTATAQWAEVQRVRGTETNLANEKRTFIMQGAADARTQAQQEAAFVRKEQTREATSDAISRGALSSGGFGQNLSAFAQQQRLANQDAQFQYSDTERMSLNALKTELEQINQAYIQGRISYQDATRQATNARERAKLNWQQTGAALNREGEVANLTFRANTLQDKYQWQQAYESFLTQRAQLANMYNQGKIDYDRNAAALLEQQRRNAATQAFNAAQYGLDQRAAQLGLQGYQTRMAQGNNALTNQLDMIAFDNVNTVAGIRAQQPAPTLPAVSMKGYTRVTSPAPSRANVKKATPTPARNSSTPRFSAY